jgi:hypothetical protein
VSPRRKPETCADSRHSVAFHSVIQAADSPAPFLPRTPVLYGPGGITGASRVPARTQSIDASQLGTV